MTVYIEPAAANSVTAQMVTAGLRFVNGLFVTTEQM